MNALAVAPTVIACRGISPAVLRNFRLSGIGLNAPQPKRKTPTAVSMVDNKWSELQHRTIDGDMEQSWIMGRGCG